MAKESAHVSEPPAGAAQSAAEIVAVSASSVQRRRWWPVAVLSILLLAFAATMVSAPGVSPIQRDAKSAYLQATPRLEGLAPVVAPELTVTPDPASFAPRIDIILPPPPPPPATGGGTGSGTSLNKADAGAFCANINSQRVANGLAALGSCYATATRQKHANAMAATSPPAIWHQGDNIVGVAPSHAALIAAFMNSPPHHDQILTSSYTGARVGCAWGQPPGYSKHLYCTADFY